jgi:hypothetical protein
MLGIRKTEYSVPAGKIKEKNMKNKKNFASIKSPKKGDGSGVGSVSGSNSHS